MTLGIHANTLRFRICRVQEVFDIQLTDPDTRLTPGSNCEPAVLERTETPQACLSRLCW